MDNELISKKELLDLTGISYGQLYRWKRKGLLPEDWFIRRSTFTGQETFFPREKICARVNRIINMKGDVSLDDLADVFSPDTATVALSADEITERGIAPNGITAIYAQAAGMNGPYGFDDIVRMVVLKRLFDTGSVNRDEAKTAVTMLTTRQSDFKDGFCEIFAVRKLGVFTCFLVSTPCEVRFEEDLTVIASISIAGVIEELKLKLL